MQYVNGELVHTCTPQNTFGNPGRILSVIITSGQKQILGILYAILRDSTHVLVRKVYRTENRNLARPIIGLLVTLRAGYFWLGD